MAPVLVLMDQSKASMETLALARTFGSPLHSVRMDGIQPFAPDAMAAMLAHVADDLNASAVFAAGPDRGNDVMARLAARTGLLPPSPVAAATSTSWPLWSPRTILSRSSSGCRPACLGTRAPLPSLPVRSLSRSPPGWHPFPCGWWTNVSLP